MCARAPPRQGSASVKFNPMHSHIVFGILALPRWFGVEKISKSLANLLRNPLIWALPLQALLLLSNLDLLDPWNDEWFTMTTVPKPVIRVVSAVADNIHPPLYFVL